MSTPLELPYAYDTRTKGRIFALGSALLMAIGFTFFADIDLDRTGPIMFVALASLGMGLLVYRNQAGARCEVTSSYINFEPDSFLGIPSAGGKGSFVASDFAAVQRTSMSGDMARVILIPARKPVPKIYLQPLRPSQANYLGELIATAMKLPLQGNADSLNR